LPVAGVEGLLFEDPPEQPSPDEKSEASAGVRRGSIEENKSIALIGF
jgi:hypothetical protein